MLADIQPKVTDTQMANAVREVEIARGRTAAMKKHYGDHAESPFWQALAQQKVTEHMLVETTLRYYGAGE